MGAEAGADPAFPDPGPEAGESNACGLFADPAYDDCSDRGVRCDNGNGTDFGASLDAGAVPRICVGRSELACRWTRPLISKSATRSITSSSENGPFAPVSRSS